MGLVWERELGRGEQTVALAMADHADDDGSKIFPSIGRIAWKTGYSERQVTRIIQKLTKMGLLILVHKSRQHRAAEYRMVITAVPEKEAFRSDTVSSLEPARDDILTSRGDISDARGDIAMSPDPSFEPPVKPPSSGAQEPAPSRDATKAFDELFTQLTGLPLPAATTKKQKATNGEMWHQPVRRMVALANGTAAYVLRETVAHMKREGLSIAWPKSVENNFRAKFSNLKTTTTRKGTVYR